MRPSMTSALGVARSSCGFFRRAWRSRPGNARALGIRAALTGPMTRGDVGTLARHLDALARLAPGVLPLYRAAAEREITLAESRGSLAPEAAESMRSLLAMAG